MDTEKIERLFTTAVVENVHDRSDFLNIKSLVRFDDPAFGAAEYVDGFSDWEESLLI